MTTIVLDVPDELKGFETALKAMLNVARAQLDRAARLGPAEYAKFEVDIAAALNEVERVVHAGTLASLDVDAPRLLINGREHARVMRTATTFYTQAGGVVVERALYRPSGDRNARVIDIVSLRSGAIEKVWLPATAAAMAHLLQQGTPREAEATAKQTGRLPYAHTTFQTVGQAVGRKLVGSKQRIEEALIERYEIPQNAYSISVSLDRVSVPMEEPRSAPVRACKKGEEPPKRPIQVVYRMAYCGTVTLHDCEGEAIHTLRYGTLAGNSPQALCRGIASDVLSLLARGPAWRLTLLCDGAPEMWNLLDAEFSEAAFAGVPIRRLVDFWHLVEKLAQAARLLSHNEEERRTIVARWRTLLLNRSNAATLIYDELVASDKESVSIGDTHPVHEAITYLANHSAADRMNYAGARRLRLPIGSGNVEATCKSLFAVRMKRPGARWKRETGEHVVALRALALSDRWDAAMKLILPAPKLSIRLAA